MPGWLQPLISLITHAFPPIRVRIPRVRVYLFKPSNWKYASSESPCAEVETKTLYLLIILSLTKSQSAKPGEWQKPVSWDFNHCHQVKEPRKWLFGFWNNETVKATTLLDLKPYFLRHDLDFFLLCYSVTVNCKWKSICSKEIEKSLSHLHGKADPVSLRQRKGQQRNTEVSIKTCLFCVSDIYQVNFKWPRKTDWTEWLYVVIFPHPHPHPPS